MNTDSKRFYRNLPPEILDLLLISNGWLIGSSIKSILEGSEITDFDIIVGPENYKPAYSFLRSHGVFFNSFGGIRCEIKKNVKVDLWVQDLASAIQSGYFEYGYNVSSNKLIKLI